MSHSKIIENIDDLSQLKWYLKNYCCLIDVELNWVVPAVDYDHPISYSKLIDSKNVTLDNGRVVSADSITFTCTEQDFLTFTEFYDWETMTIKRFRIYEKGYLPKPFVESILELYKKKTELKDVEGEEINYMISKNMLNSAYGMAVTDICKTSPDSHFAFLHFFSMGMVSIPVSCTRS